MAYRRSNGKGRKGFKLEPAVRTLTFMAPDGISYIDLSLAASIANRRAYSQNINWAVSGFTILSGASTGKSLSVFKLPETWAMENALVKSKAVWDEMNDQVLDDQPGIEGKYADFKIYFDSVMAASNLVKGAAIQTQSNANGTILTPLSEDAASGLIHTTNSLTAADFKALAAPKADWDYSTIQIPNDAGVPGATIEYQLHAVGDSTAGSMSLIEGYGLSRTRPQLEDPNTPGAGSADDWMTDITNVGDNHEEIKSDIVADNDRPPYSVGSPGGSSEYYPGGANEFDGGQLHEIAVLSGTQIGGKTRLSGGVFQCGLIKFYNSDENPVMIQVHIAPGPHRGYMCEKVGA